MSRNGRPRVAFFDFTGCEGCQLTVVDCLQDYPDLLQAVEIVQFREAMSEASDDYQVAFVEGCCSQPGDEARLRQIRARAQVVIALGTCAALGGVNALKALQPLEAVRRYVYGDQAEWFDTYDARPIQAVIPVDGSLPGCPIDRQEFIVCVQALRLGRKLPVPDYPVCVECKLREQACVFQLGRPCLGPVTRAGCGAICPGYGQPCDACRGLVSNPNDAALRELLARQGLTPDEVQARYTRFTAYSLASVKRDGHA